jgi:copper(I)-binding protein
MRFLLGAAALATFSTAALTSPLWADMGVMVGDLHVSQPMLRETPPNAPVAGGFLTIENRGDEDDVLVAARLAGGFVDRIELHEMTVEDGVMRMSEVEGGIPVPAGETVALVPGGLHLMFMGLTAPMTAGDAHEVTLTFQEAGELTFSMPVLTLGEIRATVEDGGAMGGHDTMHHGN